MAVTAERTENFEKVLSDGFGALIDAVKKSRENGKTPVILAISRRMPHVLFWFRHTYASEEQKKILSETEIITEIALPFIDFQNDPDIELFIIDDIVESGETMSYVLNLAESFARRKVSKIFILFYDSYSKFLIEPINENIEISKNFIEDEKKQILDFIATIIAVTLPIDISYPILYFSPNQPNLDLKEVHQNIFRDPISKDNENYSIEVEYKRSIKIGNLEVKEGDHNISYTSLLPSEISNSLNNDFAKIRTYFRLGDFIVVPYAPNILSDANLRNPSLFKNPEYMKIWNMALNGIDKSYFQSHSLFDGISTFANELIMNRSYRSLVSVANYLYSISSFNRITKNQTSRSAQTPQTATETQDSSEVETPSTDTEDSMEYTVKEEDLSLIVGRKLALQLVPMINDILKNKTVSPRTHEKINILSTFIPDFYDQDYSVSKYMSIPIQDADLFTKLMAIFQNAIKKRVEYPAFLADDIEYNVEGIMESFESLEKSLRAKTQEEKVEINKWVDQKIDSAEIVSRYACVKDQHGVRYWRRFFRLSSSL